MTTVKAWLRLAAGIALGALGTPVALAYLVFAGALLLVARPWPAARRLCLRLEAGARWLVVRDRRRARRLLGAAVSEEVTTPAAFGYLAMRVPLGVLAGSVLVLLLWGAVFSVALVAGWAVGRPVDGIPPTPMIVGYFVFAGVVLLFLDLAGILAVAALDRRLATAFAGPGTRAAYELRIAQLSAARADVIAAVDAERRRVERDLHDGVQQRLVALGMLVGRARRATDQSQANELLRQAHVESAEALRELRDVAWRVYPAELDDGGLPAALEAVAERSTVPVTVEVDLEARPPRAVETVAYFVVRETVTNAAKHAGASGIEVHVERRGDDLVVRVRDDGDGGADPAGGGLAGLARRVRAFDGEFRVQSPSGGPTVVTAQLPCA